MSRPSAGASVAMVAHPATYRLALIVAGFGDPGLEALRRRVAIPVTLLRQPVCQGNPVGRVAGDVMLLRHRANQARRCVARH